MFSRTPRRAVAALAASTALILALTLVPSGAVARTPMTSCLVCGTRGVADAILNVLLFVPFGVAAVAAMRSLPRAVVAGALLSALIELSQLGVAGRDPSLGDLIFNTAGALCGAAVLWSAVRWLSPSRPVAERLALGAGVAAAALLVSTGWLLQPSLPHSTYFGQWAARLAHLEAYEGTVLGAQIGDLAVPAASRWPAPLLRERLLAGAPVAVRATAGPPPAALAPIFSIFDLERREVVLLGADRGDLVVRYRTRAARLRLDQPDLRAPGALERLRPGTEFIATVSRAAPRLRAALDGRDLGELGFTLGDGWGLLMYPEAMPRWLQLLVSCGWIAAHALPVGFWARHGVRSVLAAAAVLAALVLVPKAFGLLPTPPIELAGAAGGWAAGVWLARAARRGRLAQGRELPQQAGASHRRAGTHIA